MEKVAACGGNEGSVIWSADSRGCFKKTIFSRIPKKRQKRSPIATTQSVSKAACSCGRYRIIIVGKEIVLGWLEKDQQGNSQKSHGGHPSSGERVRPPSC